MAKMNPFVTNGYVSAEYFCDRSTETEMLLRYLTNGNNVALISPRRLGKTGLISHSFHQNTISKEYYTFLVDIYATKNLQEFVFELGKSLLNTLKPKEKKAWELFLTCLNSLRTGISFDFTGMPSWSIGMGDIKAPTTTLDEIFHYLSAADKPCLVAIDEFQTIAKYPEENVEAMLRTYVQHCPNATFVYAGSQCHLMGEIFTSPARPFYQSTAIIELKPIPLETYAQFIQQHFEADGKQITQEAIVSMYPLSLFRLLYGLLNIKVARNEESLIQFIVYFACTSFMVCQMQRGAGLSVWKEADASRRFCLLPLQR